MRRRGGRASRAPGGWGGAWIKAGQLALANVASGGRSYCDAGGCRSNGPPIRQERSSILKQNDPVAQQAPPLLKMTSNGARRDAIRCEGTGAPWTMLARLVPMQPL